MKFKEISEQIIELKRKDLELRNQLVQSGQLGPGYNSEMAQLHDSNAEKLNEIVELIGYPTIDKVGKEANEAAWLVIQHSIGQPEFMKKCAATLENAVSSKEANPIQWAYLSDRIAVFEGKAQRYGTQFDWDENGEMNPQRFDDLLKVNQRRKSIGLNSVEEQTRLIREQVERENELPPSNLKERKRQYDEWRKKVGWIK